MKRNTKTQYTIRQIPVRVDRTLRQRVRESGKSFNQVVLDALISATGEKRGPIRDLSEIAGSMTQKEAALIEAEILAQRSIDPELWK